MLLIGCLNYLIFIENPLRSVKVETHVLLVVSDRTFIQNALMKREALTLNFCVDWRLCRMHCGISLLLICRRASAVQVSTSYPVFIPRFKGITAPQTTWSILRKGNTAFTANV